MANDNEQSDEMLDRTVDLVRSFNAGGGLAMTHEEAIYFVRRYGDIRQAEGERSGVEKGLKVTLDAFDKYIAKKEGK